MMSKGLLGFDLLRRSTSRSRAVVRVSSNLSGLNSNRLRDQAASPKGSTR